MRPVRHYTFSHQQSRAEGPGPSALRRRYLHLICDQSYTYMNKSTTLGPSYRRVTHHVGDPGRERELARLGSRFTGREGCSDHYRCAS